MESLNSFITLGWENITAGPELATVASLDTDGKGCVVPFRIGYFPPACSWFDAFVAEMCDGQMAS